jgi:crotonobetainyl-CoA:carnitine CoA-transferase CaiB-like acyl-CoA transferase
MSGPPLAGLRVLDLTRLLPGPAATLHLADLGAEVVKIEDPGAGDYVRQMGPMQGEASWLFRLLNRNKRNLRLDLKQPQGVDVLLRLAQDADLLVESFRPGVMARLGLPYEVLATRNPRLVVCSITGYGQDGPRALRAGHDINYIGDAGILDQIGAVGGPAALPNFPIGDLLGGTLMAVAAILAALYDVRRGSPGRHVDVSIADALLAHDYFPLLGVLASGRAPARGADAFSGARPCYRVYETADGRHMAMGALERKFWERFCEAVGRPDLKPLHTAAGAAAQRVHAELEALFRSRSRDEWVALLEPVDCCVTPVLALEESLRDPHFLARGMVVEEDGAARPATPFRMSNFQPGPARPAVAAGTDSEAILREAGYPPEAIARLREQGVI